MIAKVMFQTVAVSRQIALNEKDVRRRLRNNREKIQLLEFSAQEGRQRETNDLYVGLRFGLTNWLGTTTERLFLQRR
jgi:hypothetical protein